MKFLADMGISIRTVIWLRNQGYDAVHVRESEMQKADDQDILTKAQIEGRIVLTVDLDFGYLLAISRANLPSVILFRLGDERSEVINPHLQAVLAQCEKDLQQGAIISVADKTIRVRSLPIN